MTNYSFDPQEFANAYIQTLEHKGSVDDFDSASEYLKVRREFYLNEYLNAYADAIQFHRNYEEKQSK